MHGLWLLAIMLLNNASKKMHLLISSILLSRDTVIKPLEEKKRSLEKALYATKPEAVEKLKKLNEIELELDTVLSEIRNRYVTKK